MQRCISGEMNCGRIRFRLVGRQVFNVLGLTCGDCFFAANEAPDGELGDRVSVVRVIVTLANAWDAMVRPGAP